jgi:hypothetical protein
MQSRRKTHETRQAAVSASPQPRCPKCGNDGTGLGEALVVGPASVKCWKCATRFEAPNLADFAPFFAPAPAQEPPKLMISRSGEIHEWCPDCRGDCCSPYKPVAAQPVENSSRCRHCDRELVRRPADRHNWYDLQGAVWCNATQYKARHEPADPISGGASTGEQPPLCKEVVAYLIAGALWFACALPKGHKEEGHRAAGNCFKHGPYLGKPSSVPQCPKWPDCIDGARPS